MPTIAYSLVLGSKDEHMSLRLHSKHILVAGSPSGKPLKMSTRVPPSLDVIHQSDVVFCVCATLDGKPVLGKDLKQSALALYLVNFLKLHSEAIGLSNVSELYLDDEDGVAKFTVSSCSQLDSEHCNPYLALNSIKLNFSCRSTRENDGQNQDHLDPIDPFAAQAYLPFMTMLGSLFYRFLTHHLIARYPLIFGSSCKKFNAELPILPSICRSIFDIVDRSQDPTFRKHIKTILNRLRRRYTSATAKSRSALAHYLNPDKEETHSSDPDSMLTREQLLTRCLLWLLKCRIRPIRFKPLSNVMSRDASHTLELVPDTDILLSSTADDAIVIPALGTEDSILRLDSDTDDDDTLLLSEDEIRDPFSEFLDGYPSDDDLTLDVKAGSDDILWDWEPEDACKNEYRPVSSPDLGDPRTYDPIEDGILWSSDSEHDDSDVSEAVTPPNMGFDDLFGNESMKMVEENNLTTVLDDDSMSALEYEDDEIVVFD